MRTTSSGIARCGASTGCSQVDLSQRLRWVIDIDIKKYFDSVISPCLSNIFLHHVLDEWFEHEVRPRLAGRCTLVRFADDAVMAFEDVLDAKRVLGVLGKRLSLLMGGLAPILPWGRCQL